MVLCTERSLVKHEGGNLAVRPLRCKCWGCSHCVHQRRRDLWFKAYNGDPRIFLTLTMPHSEADPSSQAEAFVVAWRMLRQYLCRKLGRKNLTFLAVFEAHPTSGWPHLHILLRGGYIKRSVILEWWQQYTGAFIVDIRVCKGKRQVASYCSKYIAKNPARFEHVKRYWCSQDWDPPKKENAVSDHAEYAWWEAITVSPIGLARAALDNGARVTWRDQIMIIEGWKAESRMMWGIG